jgi:hypothetical protein
MPMPVEALRGGHSRHSAQARPRGRVPDNRRPPAQLASARSAPFAHTSRLPLTGSVTPKANWDAAGTQLLGASAEMLAAAHFALAGLSVYRPLADDQGVDLLVDLGAGEHLLVQVESVRVNAAPHSTVSLDKKYFLLEEHYAACLVVFDRDDPQPHLYLIPATEWLAPPSPLTSSPEYGIDISKTWRQDLAAWDLHEQIRLLR